MDRYVVIRLHAADLVDFIVGKNVFITQHMSSSWFSLGWYYTLSSQQAIPYCIHLNLMLVSHGNLHGIVVLTF